MLAKLARELPTGDFIYEPKWDGFRCIVFRRGTEVQLASRNELSLTRYFPEVVALMAEVLPESAVLDGEVVVAGPRGLDFDALSQRVHPAESRVRMLAEKTPASFVAFDLLALGESDMREEPFHERRRLLEGLFEAGPSVTGARLTPATHDRARAEDWFRRFEGAGLDGVVAKDVNLAYVPGKRVMVKVKHQRTADFVVAGFRYYRDAREQVGSLLLGLYDKEGRLAHVGVIGSFPASERRSLIDVLAPYRYEAGDEQGAHPWAAWAGVAQGAATRVPGARSRWNVGKDLSFEPLRPSLVVEAAYEHLQGDRLRHTAHFRRWRPDRLASSCTYEQLEAVAPAELADVFGVVARPHNQR